MSAMDIKDYWDAVLTQNRQTLPTYFSEDAVIRWHCTNEQFTVKEFVKVNCDYPGDWDGEIERLEANGNTIITAVRVFPKDQSASYHVTSFIKLKNEKIQELDEYWADDGEAPKWRRKMKLGEMT